MQKKQGKVKLKKFGQIWVKNGLKMDANRGGGFGAILEEVGRAVLKGIFSL